MVTIECARKTETQSAGHMNLPEGSDLSDLSDMSDSSDMSRLSRFFKSCERSSVMLPKILFIVVTISALSCAKQDDEPAEGSAGAPADASVETSPEAVPEVSPEAVPEVAAEAVSEASAEAVTEVSAEDNQKELIPGLKLEDMLGTAWYGIYTGEDKIGYAAISAEMEDYDGKPALTCKTKIHVVMTLMGRGQTLDIVETQVYDLDGKLLACETSMGPMGNFRGEVVGEQMRLTVSLGGGKTERVIPAPDVTLAEMLADVALVLRNPEIGESTRGRFFDPSFGRIVNTTSTVTGKRRAMYMGVETDIIELNTSLIELGMTAPAVMTATGDLLQLAIPMGTMTMELRKETEELAKNQEFKTFEALDISTVAVSGRMPNTLTANRLRLKVTLDDPETFPMLNDNRQRYLHIKDNVYELQLRRDIRPDVSVVIPVKQEDIEEFTRSTDIYQSDHPDIIAKAQAIVGGERDALAAVEKINDWVFQNVRKKGSAAFSNALETLGDMEGDCTEHTALFVGLCRAVGIPARGIVGVIYSPDLNGFGGHAWAEVHLGRWIAVDPSWGGLPGNPARIKLTDSDDLLETIRVMKFINEMKIEVME